VSIPNGKLKFRAELHRVYFRFVLISLRLSFCGGWYLMWRVKSTSLMFSVFCVVILIRLYEHGDFSCYNIE
jgi:hypothetical protein